MQISSPQFPALFYRKFGSGPAIVLLHGFPENGILWQAIWPSLAKSFTVIVPDLPGSGESIAGNGEITMESMAAALDAILDAEGIDKVVIAGHSMGGYVGLAFAELFADKVKGLSLVHSSTYPDDEEKKNTRRKVIELIRKGAKDAFIRQMVPALFSPETRKTLPGIIEKQVENGLALSADSMMAYCQAMLERPGRQDTLIKSTFPSQWIIGKDDSAIPFTIGLQQCTLAYLNFVSVYNNCGHMSMLENKDTLVRDLRDFAEYCYGR